MHSALSTKRMFVRLFPTNKNVQQLFCRDHCDDRSCQRVPSLSRHSRSHRGARTGRPHWACDAGQVQRVCQHLVQSEGRSETALALRYIVGNILILLQC